MSSDSVTITVRVSTDMANDIDDLCYKLVNNKKEKVTDRSAVVRMILAEHLEHMRNLRNMNKSTSEEHIQLNVPDLEYNEDGLQ